MKKTRDKVLKVFIIVLTIIIVTISGMLIFAFITDYRPKDITDLDIFPAEAQEPIVLNQPYRMVTFNIGYGALGEKQDFFMDGGKRSGAFNLEEVENNLSFVEHYISENNFDFILLQEVDTSGKRSYHIDQFNRLRSDYNATFAKNYDVKYVPVPLTNPMGGASSGLVTLSKALPTSAQRHSFNGKEMAIKQLFDLKRAFSIHRYPLENQKDFVVINAHFSAFDPGGAIRKQQLAQMKSILIHEYQKGNYVILGGDFNHELPGTSSTNFSWSEPVPDWIMTLPDDFTPAGYHWAADANNPSVRALENAYVPNETFTAVIDGFIYSDNIEVINVKGQGRFDFKHSDHNPVELIFSLNP